MIASTLIAWVTIQLIAVSYLDIKTKKISNLWIIINYLSFFPIGMLFFNSYTIQLNNFIIPLVFIFVGFLLFVLKIMGGGDSKYLSSFFLLFPIRIQEAFLECLLWTTVVIGVCILVYNIIRNLDKLKWILRTRSFNQMYTVFGKKLPFAPIILLSWLILLLRLF